MKALTFEELTELETHARRDYVYVILKTRGKFGEAYFMGFADTKAVFSIDDWYSCPNISTYGKTWAVYPLKKEEPLTITEAQFDELSKLEESDNLGAYHRKLKKLFGIKAVPCTIYDYYLDDKYIGNSYEDYPIDLLNEMGVEIEK